jgi:hypothetical protein
MGNATTTTKRRNGIAKRKRERGMQAKESGRTSDPIRISTKRREDAKRKGGNNFFTPKRAPNPIVSNTNGVGPTQHSTVQHSGAHLTSVRLAQFSSVSAAHTAPRAALLYPN